MNTHHVIESFRESHTAVQALALSTILSLMFCLNGEPSPPDYLILGYSLAIGDILNRASEKAKKQS